MIKIRLLRADDASFQRVGVLDQFNRELKGLDYTAKELRSFVEVNGKQQQERSKLIKGIKYEGMDSNDPRDLLFSSNSQDGESRYKLKLRFFDFRNLHPKSRDDIIKLLNTTDVGIYCNCPSFLYWGAAYKADQMGYGIVSESRSPKDPNKAKKDKFYACKHAQAVLRAMPFWWPAVRKDYIKYYEEQAAREAERKIAAAKTAEEKEKIKQDNEESW